MLGRGRKPLKLWTTLAVALAALTAAGAAIAPLTGLDRSIAHSLRARAAGGDYDWAVVVTDLGGIAVVVAVLAVAVAVTVLRGRCAEALALALTVGISDLVVQLTKVLVDRPRPRGDVLVEAAGFSYPRVDTPRPAWQSTGASPSDSREAGPVRPAWRSRSRPPCSCSPSARAAFTLERTIRPTCSPAGWSRRSASRSARRSQSAGSGAWQRNPTAA